MNEINLDETKLRERQELEAEVRALRAAQSSGRLAWKIVGVALLALVAAGVITSLQDIRRYIRMATI